MIRRLFRLLIALSVVPILCSCRTYESVKPTGPPAAPNNNAAESASPPVADTWSSTDLEDWIKGRKEMLRVWKKFERSRKYRLAQPGETKTRPFMTWWGAEAYHGDEFLMAIVVDSSRTDSNRYGFVVVAAPESAGGKYRAYWVTREENLENCEISVASGSVYFRCKRENGSEEVRSLAWYRSRGEFRLKSLPVRSTTSFRDKKPFSASLFGSAAEFQLLNENHLDRLRFPLTPSYARLRTSCVAWAPRYFVAV